MKTRSHIIALLLTGLPLAAAHASATLVAQLAAPPAGAARAGALAGAAPRLAALGLTPRAGLLDGLAPARPGALARGAGATPSAVPGFSPERIVLLEADDASLATAAAAALAREALVDWVEPLQMRALQMTALAPAPGAGFAERRTALDSLPNDPLLRQARQWGLYNLGSAGYYGGVPRADVRAPEGWRLGTGDETVKLAIADTGIDPAQPELGGLLFAGGARIVDAISVADDDPQAYGDTYGHGTPVAGVAVSRTNDGPHFTNSGVAGVCGGDGVTSAGCAVVPIKITRGNSGEASSWDIARAVMHAADVGARAVNLSFAGDQPSRLERLALTYALVRGCIPVAAAGNSGASYPTKPWFPAAYALSGLCIQVGASDPFDERVNFSSYGPGLDLVAPGVNIETTFMTYPSAAGARYDGYVAASGTSFAAPFVTGAVGLLAAARPELTDTDFQHILRESADDIGAPGVDAETGHGRLNLERALQAVAARLGLWHDEVAADSFAVEGAGLLTVGERGPGTMDRFSGEVYSSRIAAYATVSLPDSFPEPDSVRIWPRIGGTFAARGDFRLDHFAPTAEVVARAGRTFTLRGWLYRIEEDSCAVCDDSYVPLAPSNVRFGFTALGPVTRLPLAPPAGSPLPAAAPRFSAGPNPLRGALELLLPSPGTVTVVDASGRTMWRERGAGRLRWDGRDRGGHDAPPGLYLVRYEDARGRSATRRVVKL